MGVLNCPGTRSGRFRACFSNLYPFLSGKQLDLARFSREMGVFTAFWILCSPDGEKTGGTVLKKGNKITKYFPKRPRSSSRGLYFSGIRHLRGANIKKPAQNAQSQQTQVPLEGLARCTRVAVRQLLPYRAHGHHKIRVK